MNKDCEICRNLTSTCNLHKPKETPEERLQRRSTFIAFATRHLDTPEIRKEAGEMWDRVNPINGN